MNITCFMRSLLRGKHSQRTHWSLTFNIVQEINIAQLDKTLSLPPMANGKMVHTNNRPLVYPTWQIYSWYMHTINWLPLVGSLITTLDRLTVCISMEVRFLPLYQRFPTLIALTASRKKTGTRVMETTVVAFQPKFPGFLVKWEAPL